MRKIDFWQKVIKQAITFSKKISYWQICNFDFAMKKGSFEQQKPQNGRKAFHANIELHTPFFLEKANPLQKVEQQTKGESNLHNTLINIRLTFTSISQFNHFLFS